MIHERSVLIVDDDDVIRRLISGGLKARGLTAIDEVATLTEAANAVSRRPYDAVVTDLHLPDGNGMEFVHMIRRGLTTLNRDMVIVVSSGHVSARTARLLTRLGASEIMGKPADIDRIAAVLGWQAAA